MHAGRQRASTLVYVASMGYVARRFLSNQFGPYEDLWKDESQKNDLGQNGFEFIERNFEEAVVYKKWLYHIEEVLN